MSYLLDLDPRTGRLLPAASLSLVVGIGCIDYLYGSGFNLTLLYLCPVAIAALLPLSRLTVLVAVLSAATPLAVTFYAGRMPMNLPVYTWDFAAQFTLGLLLAWLLSAQRQALATAREAGRTDALTGVPNSGKFRELAEVEMTRAARYVRPLSMAYIDIDNFKTINDTLGHSTGDKLLRAVAQNIRLTLRKTDIVTRLGGDEFALLLPETDQEAACTAIGKLHEGLKEMVRDKKWPVTFSIGVVTCTRIPPSLDNLIEIADSAMYTVKADKKNGVNYALFDRREG